MERMESLQYFRIIVKLRWQLVVTFRGCSRIFEIRSSQGDTLILQTNRRQMFKNILFLLILILKIYMCRQRRFDLERPSAGLNARLGRGYLIENTCTIQIPRKILRCRLEGGPLLVLLMSLWSKVEVEGEKLTMMHALDLALTPTH